MLDEKTGRGGFFGSARSSIWRQTAVACALAFIVCLSLRAIGLLYWVNPGFYAVGGPLLPTPDAYTWVAGAQGLSKDSWKGLSYLIAFIHRVTGANLAAIDFWLPLVMAPLVVVPVAALCAAWGAPVAALVAGIMAGGAPAFLLRTRVGYGDTDTLTLFLPVTFIVLLWWWLRPFFGGLGLPVLWRRLTELCGWSVAPREREPSGSAARSVQTSWAAAVFPAAVFRFYMWWHPQSWAVPLCLAVGAAVLALILQRGRRWQHVAGGLAIILAGGAGGRVGAALCVVALLVAYLSPRRCGGRAVPAGLLGGAVLLVGWHAAQSGVLMRLYQPLMVYFKLWTVSASREGVIMPLVTGSVGESEGMPLPEMLFQVGLHWTIYVAGLAGFAWLVWRRAAALLLLPLLALSVLAPRMGYRFSMYGAPVIGIGVGMGVTFLLRELDQGLKRRWIIHGLMGVALAVSLQQVTRRFSSSPFLSPVYATTLSQMEGELPDDARLWTWWDFGYAAQYHSRRATFADPGRHGKSRLFALAKVFGTHTPREAAQLMYYTTETERDQRGADTAVNPGARIEYHDVAPLKPILDLAPQEAVSRLERLASEDVDFSAQLPPQYLVVSWDDMMALHWICYYGNWDMAAGEGREAEILRFDSAAMVNETDGVAMVGNSELSLASLDVVTEDGVRHREWESGDDWHLVYHAPSGEVLMMDGQAYGSMAVQLLVREPETFSNHFELVQDGFPWVRVYRAKKRSLPLANS